MQAIDQLPELNELTLEDEATVQAIENLYQQLSEEEKQKVTNLDVLEAARKKIEALKDLGDQKGTVSLTIMDGIQADTQALSANRRSSHRQRYHSRCAGSNLRTGLYDEHYSARL